MRAIIHSFTPTLQIPKPSIHINFYISFPPPLTFKNPKKPKELLNHIPTHPLFIQTHSPYLTPPPFTPKPNQPTYLKYIPQHLPQLRQITFQHLPQFTTKNPKKLFRINSHYIIS
ncbi:TatD family hydrolase, partial [Bacillus pumilus]|uniref:TatD family hydrolase n=1 Tax=Bacillus pumilus TaxID=1408 RepID=UPI003704076C